MKSEIMELFYTPKSHIDLSRGTLTIEGAESLHITKVLRKTAGEKIHCTDGEGRSVQAVITRSNGKQLSAEIADIEQVAPPDPKVSVAISLLKSPQRFDFFLEKATELGVSTLIPMITRYTVSRVHPDKANHKLERWKKILVSASCQSKRYHFPTITAPLRFDDVLKLESYDSKFIPYELSKSRPGASFTGKNVLFVVGGEGGFSEKEIDRAKEAGFQPISFGRSTLRAETAGLFAVAMLRSYLLMHSDSDCWL